MKNLSPTAYLENYSLTEIFMTVLLKGGILDSIVHRDF